MLIEFSCESSSVKRSSKRNFHATKKVKEAELYDKRREEKKAEIEQKRGSTLLGWERG